MQYISKESAERALWRAEVALALAGLELERHERVLFYIHKILAFPEDIPGDVTLKLLRDERRYRLGMIRAIKKARESHQNSISRARKWATAWVVMSGAGTVAAASPGTSV